MSQQYFVRIRESSFLHHLKSFLFSYFSTHHFGLASLQFKNLGKLVVVVVLGVGNAAVVVVVVDILVVVGGSWVVVGGVLVVV